MNIEIDKYELDEIIEEAISDLEKKIDEQRAGPQYQNYNPEQLSVLNLLRRAQQTPQGSSTFADVLRGAYSLPGTEDEIPPIPPEHLTIKDVYLQSMAFALRAAFLATSPPAGVLTLARLMFDTPPPKTATQLITRIAQIWGNAAKDVVDDAVIRAYRAVDYSINKIAIPLLRPFLAFFASGAMATAIEGRIGGNVLTVLENPTEVAKNTATVYDYSKNVLMLKGQLNNDKLFIGLTSELINYLTQYVDLYKQGVQTWNNSGVSIPGEDFYQLLLSNWNDTIGKNSPNLKISNTETMQGLVNEFRGELPLDMDLKESVLDFFLNVKFDENGGWSVVAGSAGSKSIPLPLVRGDDPVIISGNGLSKFTPNSFFDPALWTSVFWKFWSNEGVKTLWVENVSKNPEVFDNEYLINNYISSGNTVLSTNSSLKGEFLSLAQKYYIEKHGEEEGNQKLEQLSAALNGSSSTPSAEDGQDSEQSDSNEESQLSDQERRFVEGEMSYDDFANSMDQYVSPEWRNIVSGLRITPHLAGLSEDALNKFISSDVNIDILKRTTPQEYKSAIDKIFENFIGKQLSTDVIIASSGQFPTKLEGKQAVDYKKAVLTGVTSDEEFAEKVYPAVSIFLTTKILDFVGNNVEFTPQEIVQMLKKDFSA